MNCISSRLILLLAVVVLAPALAMAQQRAKPAGEEPVVKIYRVVDLVLPVPNYPYEGTYLPQMSASKPSSTAASGMMGGGMGGGMFQVPDHLAQVGGGGGGGGGLAGIGGGMPATFPNRTAGAMGFDMDQLIEAIKHRGTRLVGRSRRPGFHSADRRSTGRPPDARGAV